MIIGITGKSGVGKSTIAKQIAKEIAGLYVDIDDIGHQVLDTAEVRTQIKEQFGVDVTSTNRKALAEIVFDNRAKMKALSNITFEAMKTIIYSKIESNKNVVLDWILLPHTEFFNLCDKKILIKVADEEQRIKKVLERDNITREQLALRDKASIQYNDSDYDEIIIQNYK